MVEMETNCYIAYSWRSRPRYRYGYEELDHIELLGLHKRHPCQVMLSEYPSPLYDDPLYPAFIIRGMITKMF
jgi:hypothetical protein